jgi:UDP-glucose 4-epimerase
MIETAEPQRAPDMTAWQSRFGEPRVMITGGLGLIGSTLARRLVSFGSNVLVVDSLNPSFGGNLFNVEDIRDTVRIEIRDIRDAREMSDLLRDREIIFNLAGQTSHMDSMNAPFEDLEINCLAQLSLLEACRQLNPAARILFASTRQVYGRPSYLPVDERHPLNPVDVNGINKIAGESYHRLYHDVYRLQTTVLRLTNTYGPHMRIRDARQIFLGIWIRHLLEGRPFEVWGGRQRRDFTYVEDCADAFIAAALAPESVGKVLNVGGSEVVTLEDLARMLIEQNGGGTFEMREYPLERKLIDIGDYYTEDKAFRALTGWAPNVSLESGLARTIAFYKNHSRHYL